MKKILSLFLALLLIFSLTACSTPEGLEEDLQDLENLLGTYADFEQGLLEDLEGEAETLAQDTDPTGTPEITPEGTSQDLADGSPDTDDILEFTTEGATSETTEASTETLPEEIPSTETDSPEETEEDELPPELFESEVTTPAVEAPAIDEDGAYTTKEDVALYIHTYGKLPRNFITKSEARKLGWEGGSLEPYAPGKSIGGDRFGNYEGLLPTDRKYTECDIDTMGAKSRGAKRIVFSNDGLIYYTDDHYESFTLLYGEE